MAQPSMIIEAGKEIAKRAPFAFSEETKSLYKQSSTAIVFVKQEASYITLEDNLLTCIST